VGKDGRLNRRPEALTARPGQGSSRPAVILILIF
jgi:hypothetical protein